MKANHSHHFTLKKHKLRDRILEKFGVGIGHALSVQNLPASEKCNSRIHVLR